MKEKKKIIFNRCIITVFAATTIIGAKSVSLQKNGSITDNFLAFITDPNVSKVEQIIEKDENIAYDSKTNEYTVEEPTDEEKLVRKVSKDNPLKGIDVSCWQGNIDWSTTKNHIDFAIIRVGDAYNKDENGNYILDTQFKTNMDACETYNINKGVYFLSRAENTIDAVKEAKFVLDKVKNYDLYYPIFFDIEAKVHVDMVKNDPKRLESIINAFMMTIENSGYYSSIYACESFINQLDSNMDLSRYDKWIANYGSNEKKEYQDVDDFDLRYKSKYGIHQVSDKVKIPGIDGYVDYNFCYYNYPQIINGKFNHTR